MTSTTSASTIPAIDPDEITRPRRMARPAEAAANVAEKTTAPSKLDLVEALLLADRGTTIAEVMTVTGWQQHSVRGAIAGALKKRGLNVASDKVDGVRRYRASKSA